MNRFQNTLQYSSCSEDLESELKVLPIQNSHIGAIAGGGGRVLGLLTKDPASIDAIDFNAEQLKMLQIKMAAFKHLNYSEFCIVMGLHEQRAGRKELLARLTQELPNRATPHWISSAERHGLLYCGKLERHFAVGAKVARGVFGSAINRLIEAKDVSEQYAMWQHLRKRHLWRLFEKLGTHPMTFRLFLGNIGWYEHVPSHTNVQKTVFEKVENFMKHTLIRESHLFQLIFAGRYLPGFIIPHYLRKENFVIIRDRIDRIKIQLANVVDYLSNSDPDRFHALSLSNIGAYLSDLQFTRLVESLARTLKSQGRTLMRDFLFHREIHRPCLAHVTDLEILCQKTDRSFAYDFTILEKTMTPKANP